MSNTKVLNDAGSSTTSSKFSVLAVDVILKIWLLLPLPDLLAVRLVSVFFHQVAEYRLVWLTLLRRHMRTHSISEITYPLDSLPLDLIKRLTLSFNGFAMLVKKKNGGKIFAHSHKVIPSWTGLMDDFILAPGGRYLITVSTDCIQPGYNCFNVWDLGLQRDPITAFIVRHQVAVDNLELKLFFPDPHTHTTFWVTSVERLTDSLVLYIHKLVIAAMPSMTLFARYEVPSSALSLRCLVHAIPASSKIVIVSCHGGKVFIRILDFVKNEAALLVTHLGWFLHHGDQAYFYDDCVLYAARNSVAVWNMPPLEPCPPGAILSEHLPVVTDTLTSSSQYPIYLNHNTSTTIIPTSNSSPCILRVTGHTLDVVQVASGENTEHDPTGPNRRALLQSTHTITITHDMREAIVGKHLGRCGDYLCATGTDAFGSTMALVDQNLSLGADGRIDLDFANVRLAHPIRDLVVSAQVLCPFTRRLIILSPEGEIYVFVF